MGKRWLTSVWRAGWLGAAGLFAAGAAAFAATNPPIYVTIVMHSEQGSPYHSNPILFEANRTNLYRFAKGLSEIGAKFNFQSDWTFLAGVTNFDFGARPETGGTNIVAWMQNDLGFEIDPHNHVGGSVYNYADVAALAAACGAKPTALVGGFVAYPPESNEWPTLQGTLTGAVFAAFTWTPRALWGASSKNHADDTNLWFSGVYCPAGTNAFWTHAAGNLPIVGGYGGRNEVFLNLDRLLARRDLGLLCTGSLYTVNLMANMSAMDDAYIANFLARASFYTNVPNLRFVTLGQLTNVWATEYGAAPFYYPWEMDRDVDADEMDDGWEVTNFCGIAEAGAGSDFDEDRQSDRDEYVAGTSPTDSGARFELIAENGRGETVWTAVTGRIYEVEVEAGGVWTTAGYCVTGAAPLHVWTNPFIAPTSSWCRVRARMP